MNYEKASYLGIDIGGTAIKHAVITNDGRIISEGIFDTRNEPSLFLLDIIALIDKAIAESEIQGVGISCLGIIDPAQGRIVAGAHNMVFLETMNIVSEIKKKHPQMPVNICNDVWSMAMGELWQGAGRDYANIFCITLGTGLGGCAIVKNEIISGAHSRAGEIGFFDYRSDINCLETQLSTKHAMMEVAKLLGVSSIDGQEFFDLVQNGNEICSAFLEVWAMRIARMIANIIIFFDPEVVLIGGGVSKQGDILLYPIRRHINTFLPKQFHGQTKIMMAHNSNKAGMLGAVKLLIDRISA